MSGDIEQRLRAELQRLLDGNPNLEPTQFIFGNQIVTVAVTDGIPQLAKSNVCGVALYGCPRVSDLHGSPAYHIYNLMQSLQCLDEERLQQGAAHILTLTPVEEKGQSRLDTPEKPSPQEVLNSTLDNSTDLRTKSADNGMFHHLKLLQRKYEELLTQQPELESLILQTPKGSLEIRVTNHQLFVSPSMLQGQPFTEVQKTPQVRTYLLHKTIQGLEAALYGDNKPIEVSPPVRRNKAEENLILHLGQARCDELVVPIRRSRKNLYISGKAGEITYLPLRVRIADDRLCVDEQVQDEPGGHARMEYRDLPAETKQLVNAFFAYLSSRTSNGSRKH
jgi:hypothetical protein